MYLNFFFYIFKSVLNDELFVVVQSLSHVQPVATLWTIVCQAFQITIIYFLQVFF